MATKRTLDLLPSIFQTDTNKKFLSATLDQLVSEPDFTRLDSYIGRKFAPTYRTTDGYVTEIDKDRQNYQLEPSVVIKNSAGQVDFYSSYTDLINKLSYYGGKTDDHNRLFAADYYSYNGLFDFDKFVNFSQYYWLPNGPAPVQIGAAVVASQHTYVFDRDAGTGAYTVDGGTTNNPDITLVRGGLYKFLVSQPGSDFWIQTEPGVSGTKKVSSNITTRTIYGVDANGKDIGLIEFSVPLVDSQDLYLKMPTVAYIDYAVDTAFSDIDGKVFADIVAEYNGLDGMDINPDGKAIAFLGNNNDDANWTRADSTVVAEAHRRGIWKVRLIDVGGLPTVKLDYIRDIATDTKIYIRSGRSHTGMSYYKDAEGIYQPVPILTAQYDTLYYQDGTDARMNGRIRLVESTIDVIEVESSIVGKTNYTSSAGVVFTNGLIIEFDSNVFPASYANQQYIVEGVGHSIVLVKYSNLISVEPGVNFTTVAWDITNYSKGKYEEINFGPADPDYLVINRGSPDLNAWARQNRWFHIDVIVASAAANGTVPLFDQAVRAQRPIIEFEAGVQLFNNGRIGKRPVNHIDTTYTDAFNQVQHSKFLDLPNLPLAIGQRVLFANDHDELVRSQIYVVDYQIQNEPSYSSIYDGTLSGTILVEQPVINFESFSDPVLQNPDSSDVEIDSIYTWVVSGNEDILNAVAIDGFEWPYRNAEATITDVSALGSNRYQLTFTIDTRIGYFINYNLLLRGPGGIDMVYGTDTKFTTELEVGAALYDLNNAYIGTVKAIATDTRLQLVDAAPAAAENIQCQFRDPRIQLIISPDADDALLEYDTVVAITGSNAGVTFWYNGINWIRSQQKTSKNQAPLFDVFDAADNSFGSSAYLASNFVGSKVFSYKTGSGPIDKILNFPLSYSNTNNTVADIVFDNNFDSETFEYRVGTNLSSVAVCSGHVRQNITRYESNTRNVWSTVVEPSKQYQIISKVYTGRTNHFEIDALPAVAAEVPTLKVFLNNVLLQVPQYVLGKAGARNTIKLTANLLTVGDKIDILIYSNTVSGIGYYQIPANLEYNSENKKLTTLSLGQLRNHLATIGQNSSGIVGSVPGVSNIRDFDIKAQGGNILQHAAPTIYASLFLISDQANFVNGLDYARREYTKFKNKFLELSANLPGLDYQNPAESVDTIISSINYVKNKSFSWYYSDMVPYGQSSTITYTVVKVADRQYKISSTFDDTVLQSRAILVYVNGTQLIKDQDYVFDSTRPAIHITDSVMLTVGATIEIKEYNTDGNYIPETPTKLGLYPKFLPCVIQDDTYRTPMDVIQCHDGSLTPAFGDFRDLFLLELERRIYNNIKVDHNKAAMDIREQIPGRFRLTDYSLTEYNKIISTGFMKWAGTNRVDYISNSYFESNDQFSYNYRNSKDRVFGEAIPAYWRGIYKYFYDTDRPHSHPWEMIGFTEQPTWWTDTYGEAPYTSGNALLWEDLENGVVQQGTRAGTHEIYKRPGLSLVLPVDESGNLRSPLTSIAVGFSSSNANAGFVFGDCSPAEAAWTKTSEYPFALQQAVAMMKPAKYFGTLFDTSSYMLDNTINQFVIEPSLQRVTPTDIVLNGETVLGATTRASGYVNYIVDYLTSLGIDATTKLRTLLTNLNVQLTYKVAGYTDKNYLTVLAEQYSPTSTNSSVIVPDESYDIYLNKSVPIERVAYSAVIVEKTQNGYSVSGYNTNNPYFIIVPSETSGTSYTINVEKLTGVVYYDYKKQKLSIPYGQEFKTRQQLVDFLVSYQRYLLAQGFIFDEYNQDLSATQDWILSAKEFLSWTLQGWGVGSVLVLSPCGTKLKLTSSYSIVDVITNDVNSSRLLDPNFAVIRTNTLMLVREPELFTLEATTGQTVAFAELNLTQYEHVLLFDNSTVFNDIIYKPELGSRQFRLKLVGDKTANWLGSLNPPGFIYNSRTVDSWMAGRDYLKGDVVAYKKLYYVAIQPIAAEDTFSVTYWRQIDKSEIKTGLLSNFSNNASKFIDIYDVDSTVLDKEMARMSNGLIGFRNRSYLDNLNVSSTSQTKFYQGFIKEKGTRNAIESLLSTGFNNLQNSISYYEEWAVRVGEYGAQSSNQTVEIQINEAAVIGNPVGFAIIADNATAPIGLLGVTDRNLYSRPFTNEPVSFLDRDNSISYENDIQTAGYVNLNDIDATVFDSASYDTISSSLADISSGYTVWVAKDSNTDWQVYRTSETDNTVTRVEYSLDRQAKVTTKNIHNLQARQTVLIKQLDSVIDGFYSIVSVTDLKSFTIAITADQNTALRSNAITGTGYLFSLSSSRFNSPADITQATPLHGWKDGDHAWVDTDEENKWATYEKTSPWKYSNALDIQLGTYNQNALYGSAVRVDPAGKFVVAGSPGDNNGRGGLRVFSLDADINDRGVLSYGAADTRSLGFSVDVSNNKLVSGAPDSQNQSGLVVIYNLIRGVHFEVMQVLANPDATPGSSFGHSVSISKDNTTLYIGAPGVDKVYVYELKTVESKTNLFRISTGQNSYTLPYDVVDPADIMIYDNETLLSLNQDYTIAGNVISLATGTSITESGILTVRQQSHYKFVTSISAPVAGTFGHSVKTTNNGSMVVIGAPGTTVSALINAGAAYVYTRRTNNEYQLLEQLVPAASVYRGKFGSTVEICKNNCSVYVGAPGYSDSAYAGGAVYRYVNSGLVLGTVAGTTVNPSVVLGHSLIINGVTVALTGGSINTVVSDINQQLILGVTASNVDNHLVISSTVEVPYAKLNVVPGVGSAMSALGIAVFASTQKITKPLQTNGENFGYRIRLGADSETLLVSSTTGTIKSYSIVDTKTTTFDGLATQFLDIALGSGSVYMHDFLPSSGNTGYGNFGFVGEFNAPLVKTGDQFGSDIDMTANIIVIGAAFNDSKSNNAGQVYQYTNATGTKSWNKIRQQQPKVDVTSINRMFLHSAKAKSILSTLDYIDPAKGKILGIASQDLDFKSSRDPADYNAGSLIDTTDIIDYYWGNAQVGKTWWNLSKVRFIDYEQSDLNYRLNNWGTVFPGSSVEVYEWIESAVLPSEYIAEGTPLHSDNSAYVTTTLVEPVTGMITTKYYFWVRGISNVSADSTRILSSKALESAIEQPDAQGIPYATVLSNNSIGLVNCQGYFSGTDTILQIDYDAVLNNNLMHSEYELVQEGNGLIPMPSRIVDKLVDSLASQDAAGDLVPDIKIRPAQKTGLSLRPRQTLISDASAAMRNIAEYVNSVFSVNTAASKLQNSSKFASSWFYKTDDKPSADEYDFTVADLTELEYVKKTTGTRVLVLSDSNYYDLWTLYSINEDGSYKLIKNQAFDTTKLWNFTTWYAADYDSTVKPTYIVNEHKDTEVLTLVAGDIVKIRNINSPFGFELYQYTSATVKTLVGLEKGTLMLNSKSWDVDTNQVGFDNQTFDAATFDLNYAIEIRNIMNGLKDDILVNDLADNYNRLLFVIIGYILSEQQTVDWIFKTSFISILHNIRKLDQFPNYIKDNQDYYADYINEVKPYRTKIRDYKLSYSKTEAANTHVTDFDLPAYYDAELGRFRSPSGEYPNKDGKILLGADYIDWSNNFLNTVDRVIISNPGTGYIIPPSVKIMSSDGFGTGATADAFINEITGAVSEIVITNGGSGYRSTPLVIINGTGSGAAAGAVIGNLKTRSIKTVLRFDRVSYTTDIVEWLPTKSYPAGTRVSYQGRGYVASDFAPARALFNSGIFKLLADSAYNTTNDRIAALYDPTEFQIPKEYDSNGVISLERLVPNITNPYNQIAAGTGVNVDTIFASQAAGDVSTGAQVINLSGGSFYDKKLAYGPEELIPGATLDQLNIKVVTQLETSKVAFRITKTNNNVVKYTAIAAANMTTLSQDLHWDDDILYLSSVSGLSIPSPQRAEPGVLYVNGEKITYFQIDYDNSAVTRLRRGVDNTGTPLVHLQGAVAEDSSAALTVPGTGKITSTSYKFNKKTTTLRPNTKVAADLDQVRRLLTVWIGANQLTLDQDFTIQVDLTDPFRPTAIITFTAFAIGRLSNGIRIIVKYTEDFIWLNPGATTPADGTGFEGSTTQAVEFLKNKPYILS